MNNIVAYINQEWINLSNEHGEIQKEVDDNILRNYLDGKDIHPSYLITGVFGAGKSTLMVYVFKKSLDMGVLPIYILAEDISKLIDEHQIEGHEKLAGFINKYVKDIKNAFKNKDFESIEEKLLYISGKDSGADKSGKIIKSEAYEYLKENYDKVKNPDKIVLLVDELEDTYKDIKSKIGSDPLRTFLEDKSFLKFFAMTPSGIHDLGGADETRFIIKIIPSLDIEYLRKKYDLSAEKCNALWWLSRGNPRHIILNYEKIGDLDNKGVAEIKEILDILPPIGKDKGAVPSVDIEDISHSKIKYIFNLKPIECDPYRGFKITKDLASGEGDLSEKIFQEKFDLKGNKEECDIALKLAGYFRKIAMTLSGDDLTFYMPKYELNDFIELVVDMFLDKEHKNLLKKKDKEKDKEILTDKIMIKLYEIPRKLKEEPDLITDKLMANKIMGIEFSEEFTKKLPFAIKDIRKMFPLPIANPIIKNIDPEEVKEKIIGKGKPVCKIDDSAMFFISYKDFKEYAQSEEFKSKVLPEGRFMVVLLPEEEYEKYEKHIKNLSGNEKLLKILEELGKIKVVNTPQPIVKFLLTIYDERYPFDFNVAGDNIKSDITLKRKFELYEASLKELINDHKAQPKKFFEYFDEKIKKVDSVWGIKQISEENKMSAISGLSLAFYDLSFRDRENLSKLRGLFKTRNSRGKCADIKVGKGLTKLADDLLPKIKDDKIEEQSSIREIREFWSKSNIDILERLVNYLNRHDFLKLSDNENHKRLLESFWRAKRDEYNISNINGLKDRLEECISKLRDIREIKEKMYSIGINWNFKNDEENIIVSLEGLEELNSLEFSGKLPKYIYQSYLGATLEKIESKINKIYRDLEEIKREYNDLIEIKDNIIKLLEENPKILDYLGDKITFEKIKDILEESLEFGESHDGHTTYEVKSRLETKKQLLRKLREYFENLRIELNDFKKILENHDLLEGRK